MNKVFIIALAMVLAVSMVPLGCTEQLNGGGEGNGGGNVTPPVAENIELDFATFWPARDFQAVIGFENWARTLEERVAAETPHTLKINMYYSVPPRTTLWEGLRDGRYDIGAIAPGWGTPEVFPLWESTYFPADLHRNNALTMSLTVQALYNELTPLQEEMAAQDLKVLHFWSTGPGYFFMTPGNEVRRLADFPGKRIRVSTRQWAACIEALGAQPVLVGIYQVPANFEAGLLDGILCPGDVPQGFGLGAYVKHCSFAPFSYQCVFAKVMNEDTWNALPPDVQAIFDEVNAAWPEYYGKLRTWAEADGLQFCYSTIPGFTYYDLPKEDPAEYATWIAATEHLVKDWIGENATRQALWDKFIELDEYYATTEPWSTWTPEASPPPVPTFP